MAVLRANLRDFRATMLALGKRVSRAANTGLIATAQRARDIMDAETRAKRKVNTGIYRLGWKADVLREEHAVHVYNRESYAGVVEYGRRPYPSRVTPRPGASRRAPGSGPIPMSSLPPFRKALVAWVMRKFRLPYPQAYRRMWPIANAINRRGIPGSFVLRDSIPAMRRAMDEEMLRELRRALGGT